MVIASQKQKSLYLLFLDLTDFDLLILYYSFTVVYRNFSKTSWLVRTAAFIKR